MFLIKCQQGESVRFLFCLSFFISLTVHSLPAEGRERSGGILWGRVSSGSVPLADVNILLEGTQVGSSSDRNGEYEIIGIPPGQYKVVGRLLGYRDTVYEVSIREGRRTRLDLILTEGAIALGEVEVSADRMRRFSDVRPSVISLAPRRAKTLPGVAEDVLRTLQSLPGILSPSDFSSQLVIRGSGPDQNLIIMDDIEVFNPYRLYGLISMFNPETALDIQLITGGFPSKYGDRLSAVLDVTNKEGDRSTPLNGSLNASITNANLVLSGYTPFGIPGSYVLSARRTYYDLILGPIAKNAGLVKGDVAFPNFRDIQGKLVLEPGSGHKILFNSIFSKDAVHIVSGPERERPDSVAVTDDTKNDVLGVAWHYISPKQFLTKVGFSWYRNGGISDFGGSFLDPVLDREVYGNGGDTTGIRLFSLELESRYQFSKYSLKTELAWIDGDHAMEFGASIDMMKTSLIWHFQPDSVLRGILLSRNVAFQDDFVQKKEYERVNLYFQDRLRLSNVLSVQPGLRLDYFGILGKPYLSPRVNLLYALNPITSLRVAWGLYYQSPGYEKLLDQQTFVDLTNASVGRLEAERATHYVLGLEHWLDNTWQMRVETYFKRFDNVITQKYLPGSIIHVSPIPGGDIRKRSGWSVPIRTSGDSLTTLAENGATGRSYGFEILLEKKNRGAGDRLTGWIGYSLARAERVRRGFVSPFRFDQLHTINIVLDYQLASWLNLGIRWRYGTNFPYTPPTGIVPRVVPVSRDGTFADSLQIDRDGNVVFDLDRGGEENLNSGRLPEYHRLDVRLNATADYWGLDWDFYLDVINVYNRANVLRYQFFIRDDLSIGRNVTTMFPILPTIGVSIRF